MSSFGEKKAVQFAKEQGRQYVEFTRRQLARIYPAGTRIDSSNYDPVALWNAGCQLGETKVVLVWVDWYTITLSFYLSKNYTPWNKQSLRSSL